MVDFKKKLADRKATNSNGSSGSKVSGIRNKFKKRDQSVLDKIYDERESKSKATGSGRQIFNQDVMDEFGVVNFETTEGDRFVEALPISFDPNTPYFRECSVHFSVGSNADAFLCLQRFPAHGRKGKCYRCETQNKMWRDRDNYEKDDITALYPTDRVCYLLWDRTRELVEQTGPDYTLQLWASPKTKVHAEIQSRCRNKVTRKSFDISDINEGGEGKTITFTIDRQGKHPSYKAFDLMERETPIPDEILEKLDAIITAAEERGFEDPIDMFFNVHEYDELKEAMAEADYNYNDDKSNDDDDEKETKVNNSKSLGDDGANDEDAIIAELEEYRGELEELAGNKIKWKMFLKKNGYDDAVNLDPEEAIEYVLEQMYEERMG